MSIAPALVLGSNLQEGLVDIGVLRGTSDEMDLEPVTLAEACARAEAFFAEVAAEWNGDHGLILQEGLPQELTDLLELLSADSGQD